MANLSNINNKFLVTTGGNVGINTTSPDEKLSVNGNIFLQGNDNYIAFNTSASSGHPKIKMNSDADFSFLNTAGSNVLHIENGGNVGIGTADPDEKLVLYKPIGYSSDSALYSAYAVNSTAVDNNKVFKWKTGITGNQSGHNLTFSTLARTESSYVERMRIDSSGNSTFQGTVKAISYTGKAYPFNGEFLGGADVASANLQAGSTNGFETRVKVFGGGNATPNIITMMTASTERMRIDSSGAVLIGNGVGKIDTATKLQVSASDSGITQVWANADDIVFENNNNFGITLATPNTGAATIAFADPEAVNEGYIQYVHGDDYMRFATSATERMRITSDGFLLVGGTDSPSTSWKGTAVFGQQGTRKVIIGYLTAFSENVVGGHNSALNAWDSLSFAATDFKFRTGSGATDTSMIINSSGNVGIGTTNNSYKLEVQGDTYINGRDFGKAINYASAQGWIAADPTGNQTAFYNGNFTPNGGSTENKVYWDYNYAGQRALIWRSQNNDAGGNADGGWNKMMNVASNNMGYMSVVYVKKNTSSDNGSFYHGCYGGNTLYLTGTANTNPYFHSFGVATLPQDVWCISIGFIQANNDSNTANNSVGGVYRLDTGVKIHNASTFKMGTDSQIRQQHRAYLYYSTDVNQNLSFSDPGFYALDGSQPSISDLFGAGVPTPSSSSPFGQALKTYSSSANVTVATTVNASTVANLVSGHITITASTGASIIVKTFGIYETSNLWFKDEASPEIENANNDIVIACSGSATNTLTFTVGDPGPTAGYGMTVSIQASPPGFFNL